ncbi:hypothetical protein PSTT_10344 [Puccinia striiformis]|uniref:Secreted protein n=2 Tax=Puccinia striiformis TaxID=27350 RepID=A0A0L0VGB7_9BASI|nr:hypothetical protein PSTG_08523 [Puccinia striiformis f. sp. tritici PST-78]POW04524.1 hypothetical protein PSTT_10344 [Puccinia striiformis]
MHFLKSNIVILAATCKLALAYDCYSPRGMGGCIVTPSRANVQLCLAMQSNPPCDRKGLTLHLFRANGVSVSAVMTLHSTFSRAKILIPTDANQRRFGSADARSSHHTLHLDLSSVPRFLAASVTEL